MKFESDGGTDDSTPELLAKSAEMKRLVGIAVANGTPIRVAYKDVRRRMRLEARRQKELDEGVEPEVVLDSFLDQVKVEQQQQSGPLKRVFTRSAKAAKHRRARDKKLRETLCWWIANDKVCLHGDRCNFRHTVSEIGALLQSLAPEQCVRLVCHGPVLRLSKTRVRPVCRRPVRQRIRHIQEVRRVTAGTNHGTGMTIVTSGLTSGRMVTMATDGFMAGTSTATAMTGRTLGESEILALCVNTMMTTRQMRGASANLMMSGVRVTGKRAVGARAIGRRADTDECSNDLKEQMRSSHSFFEAKNQLISSLCRGNDVATFSGIEVDPVESLADTAAQSGIIDVRPFRKAEEAPFHKFGLKPRVIPVDNQAVGTGGRAKVLGKVEMPSGMGGVNGIVKYTVVDSLGVPPLTPVSLLKQVGAVRISRRLRRRPL